MSRLNFNVAGDHGDDLPWLVTDNPPGGIEVHDGHFEGQNRFVLDCPALVTGGSTFYYDHGRKSFRVIVPPEEPVGATWEAGMPPCLPPEYAGDSERVALKYGPPAAIARKGRVRFDGKVWIDDDGPFLPLTTTLLYALGRWHKGESAQVVDNMRWAKARGCDAVRVLGQVAAVGKWGELGLSVDPRGPSWHADLCALVDTAYDQIGLRVKLTLVGSGDPNPLDSARRVAAVVAGREHKFLLLEAVNEGNAPADVAEAIVRIFATTGVPCAVGLGNQGIEQIKESTAIAGASVSILHTDRTDGDNGARQVRQCWDLKEFKTAVDDGEGPGPGSSVADFPDVFKNAAKRAGNIICGAGSTCNHTGDGVYGESYGGPTGPRYANLWERPSAEAQFEAVRHASDHLPPEVAAWSKFNTGHPLDVLIGSVNKLYGARDGSRAFEIAIGCESPVVFRARQALTVTFWNPATGESAGTFTLTAGQTCQPERLWAYVIELVLR